jgi:D-serine deaminase-like pyridoxal phosphate-dependent protein
MLTDRLRRRATEIEKDWSDYSLFIDAANEIEKLQAKVDVMLRTLIDCDNYLDQYFSENAIAYNSIMHMKIQIAIANAQEGV